MKLPGLSHATVNPQACFQQCVVRVDVVPPGPTALLESAGFEGEVSAVHEAEHLPGRGD